MTTSQSSHNMITSSYRTQLIIVFQVTETCEYTQGDSSVCLEREREREREREKERERERQRNVNLEKSDRRVEIQERVKSKETGGVDKQGLFVEFIQFLMRIGMFNEQVVRSMLSNKELFL